MCLTYFWFVVVILITHRDVHCHLPIYSEVFQVVKRSFRFCHKNPVLTHFLCVPHAPPLILLICEEALSWRLSYLAGCCYNHLGSNVLLSSLFPNTHSLCSSLNRMYKILHPHKTGQKITVTFLPLLNAQNSSGAHPVVRDSFSQKYSGRDVKLTTSI